MSANLKHQNEARQRYSIYLNTPPFVTIANISITHLFILNIWTGRSEQWSLCLCRLLFVRLKIWHSSPRQRDTATREPIRKAGSARGQNETGQPVPPCQMKQATRNATGQSVPPCQMKQMKQMERENWPPCSKEDGSQSSVSCPQALLLPRAVFFHPGSAPRAQWGTAKQTPSF